MKKCALILALALIAGVTASAPPAVSETDEARLICLNIGKADCMLLMYQEDAFLIDAGYEQTWPALKTMLDRYGVTRLNGVFLTHCHEDHMGGLTALAQTGIAVDAWYASRIYSDVKEGRHPAVLAAAVRNESVTWLDAGNTIRAGSDGLLTVLGPLSVDTDNENNNSLVMRFSSPQGSILFAGDMKEDEENELLLSGAFSSCDVLKAGHHGDNKATTLKMLKIVQPKIAVILTDTREEPDTPAVSTLQRLNAVGCAAYISQDFHDALMVTLKNNQQPAVTDVVWEGAPRRAENVSLAIDASQDTLTIINRSGESLNLAGCSVYSTKGNELFALPDAAVAPGGQFVTGTESTGVGVDWQFSVKRLWHKKKLDRAILYDAYGRVLACTDNGLEE